MAITQVFAGTGVTGTVTFTNALEVITDPVDVTILYRPGPNGTAVSSVYGIGSSTIVKVSVGIYSL